MNEINVFNLCFSYNSSELIFDKANLNMRGGRIYLLTGENGSGKSTLLKLMAGLITGESADYIQWNNKNYRTFSDLKREVLYVNESPYLYEYLTGWENINLLIELFHLKEERTQIIKNIEEFHLKDVMDKMTREYSLGMKYKLFLSVALTVHAGILELDEPFASLDLESQEIAQKKVEEFASSGGIVLISTHVMDYIEKYEKYHYVIEDGRLNYHE